MKPVVIRAYNTHIEVRPYSKGDCFAIEKKYSKWDKVTHQYIRVGYFIDEDTLYLPRGTSFNILSNYFHTIPEIINRSDPSIKIDPIDLKYDPRDRIQDESVDFLTSKGRFKEGIKRTQYGLNLDTGDGKTFCMIDGISKLRQRTIIITHKTRIKDQWIKEFLDKTYIDEDRVVGLKGSTDMEKVISGDLEADIYVCTHQTIASFARLYGWSKVREFFKKGKIGIKVFDEAHKFFENILMIDFFSNTKRTYYLTATFTRNDPKEVVMFKQAFSSLYRFGEETLNYDEKRKHINLIEVMYRSNPPTYAVDKIMGSKYGFNSYRYIDYALKIDEYKTMEKVIKKIIRDTKNLEGKTLITSPKIESVELIADIVRKVTDKPVGVVHSRQPKAVNDAVVKTCDIISSTIKGIGEGDDIKGLRVLINTEPIASKGLVDQLRGRLREYSPAHDTYLFYLIDAGVPYTYTMYTRIKSVFSKKCKKIYKMRIEV
jgi:superfamily II DNA or RNA helicase